MFEKEAEELDKMAEKSYAKDIQYIGMSANITYKLGFKAGYNKANEWHYPSKGEYPKEDCEVIILHKNGKKTIQKWKNGNWANAIVIPVIAWKEIVLPELKENE